MKVTEILPPEQKAAGSNPAEGTEKVGPDQQVAGTGPLFGQGAIPQTAPYEPNSTLPCASAETVRDPDWIAARLRDAVAADYPDYHLRELLAEVSTWTTDADEKVAAITEHVHLPALDWERRARAAGLKDGRWSWVPELIAHEFEHGDHAAVAWATELRLLECAAPAMPGTREWTGYIEGWRVTIWTVTDRDQFDAAVDASISTR